MTPVIPRPNVRRAVVLLPNGFTLANLFFGIFAIVSASRGRFSDAGVYVVLGGICDALDGRVARFTRTGSRFGEELDSLVDAISFGLAPALIMYFAVLNREGWDWVFAFLFAACAVMRLARFNVEQAGKPKTYFHGLPSPAAGMTLATYYAFSQTPLYNETLLLGGEKVLADLPWHVMMRFIMAGLAFLMVSDVPYPAVPTVNLRTTRGILAGVFLLACIVGLIVLPREFFFPILMAYVIYGLVRSFVLGVIDRVPTGESIYLEEEEDDDDAGPEGDGAMAVARHEELAVGRRRRRRRRKPRGPMPTPTITPPVEGE
ncbi:MAG TPA: CDP-diacylglycerol--serine O-phosphatidyltransferase [Gemmatimonadaceae bacterium]|nr:CDP-diacylglycerol--serine O-phosphatidyltransferase [Gemmatimonadaceae bacterium]